MTLIYHVTKSVIITEPAGAPPEWWVVDLRNDEDRDGKIVQGRFNSEAEAIAEADRLNGLN